MCHEQRQNRRDFIKKTGLAVGAITITINSLLSGKAKKGMNSTNLTINDVINKIISTITEKPLKETVDIVKIGNPKQTVNGITTTFLASCEVIQKSIDLGNNFIISHEPIFYNHLDEVNWLESSAVYRFKKELLEKNNIVVWRCHDYWHLYQPDGIMRGIRKKMGWEKVVDPQNEFFYALPNLTVSKLAAGLKQKLDIKMLRIIGDPNLICRKVAFLAGKPGGRTQIQAIIQHQPDVIICGEINEWETSELIRDAIFAGEKKALIITGHSQSEEAGMEYMATWLSELFPELRIQHIPVNEAFWYSKS